LTSTQPHCRHVPFFTIYCYYKWSIPPTTDPAASPSDPWAARCLPQWPPWCPPCSSGGHTKLSCFSPTSHSNTVVLVGWPGTGVQLQSSDSRELTAWTRMAVFISANSLRICPAIMLVALFVHICLMLISWPIIFGMKEGRKHICGGVSLIRQHLWRKQNISVMEQLKFALSRLWLHVMSLLVIWWLPKQKVQLLCPNMDHACLQVSKWCWVPDRPFHFLGTEKTPKP
jgi:hypothetical protein